jgi:hypothetical protein
VHLVVLLFLNRDVGLQVGLCQCQPLHHPIRHPCMFHQVACWGRRSVCTVGHHQRDCCANLVCFNGGAINLWLVLRKICTGLHTLSTLSACNYARNAWESRSSPERLLCQFGVFQRWCYKFVIGAKENRYRFAYSFYLVGMQLCKKCLRNLNFFLASLEDAWTYISRTRIS